MLKKYSMAGILGILALHLFGIIGAWIGRGEWDKSKMASVNTSSKVSYHSVVLKQGKPDTTFASVSVQIKERIRHGEPGFENSPGVDNSEPGNPMAMDQGTGNSGTMDQITAGRSGFTRIHKEVTQTDGTISLDLKTYPDVDSVDIAATYQGKQRTIKQTNTLEKKDSSSTDTREVFTIEPASIWKLNFGTSQFYGDGFILNKYIDLNYSKKIWFFYLTAGGGVMNEFGAGLKDLKLHTKIEIGISL